MGKIKPCLPKGSGSSIVANPVVSLDQDVLRFSFKHLDYSHPKFKLNDQGACYFLTALERLKSLSSMKLMELLHDRTRALKFHSIDWNETSEPSGFSNLNSQLRELTPYQFSLSSNEHGRVHGFILDNVFFIVWFDPGHKLYP